MHLNATTSLDGTAPGLSLSHLRQVTFPYLVDLVDF